LIHVKLLTGRGDRVESGIVIEVIHLVWILEVIEKRSGAVRKHWINGVGQVRKQAFP